ncbi:hypothetical protein HHK36_006296 [Tetracentron sinense]|uniref:Uncharacterized protein n=1 Tax=Tetracentron sinense TaxID=13715 RepID=A0A834ZKL1_TETSI|nr:hypothetical protein HHK36_006296 [Tetracentron sinense]
MNHSTVDFMEVRKLVLQHELEPGLQPRIDDAALFRASNEIIKVKIAICNLRERAMVINQKLSLAPHLEELQMQQIEEEGSIWFDEATFSELLCSFPVAVARCPDLLCPEILVPGVLTTKHAGSLLQACLMYVPILRKQCIELLAEFILKCTQIRHVSMCYKPQDPLISHCLQQSYSVMESFFCSDTHMAFILREALVRRCICANIVIQITVGVLKDGVDFLNRIIFSDGEICQWFISCIRSREKTTEMGFSSPEVEKLPMFTEPLTSIHLDDASQLKEATVLQLRKALHVAAKAAFHEDQWSNHLYCYLKLYCVLVHLGGLQPIHEEVPIIY